MRTLYSIGVFALLALDCQEERVTVFIRPFIGEL